MLRIDDRSAEGGVKSVTAQQQAFQAYYSSMTDAELMKIAANKRSFLDVAQAALDNELRGRNLTPVRRRDSAYEAVSGGLVEVLDAVPSLTGEAGGKQEADPPQRRRDAEISAEKTNTGWPEGAGFTRWRAEGAESAEENLGRGLRAPGFGAVHVAQVLDVETDGVTNCGTITSTPLSSVAGLKLVSCCWCAGGAVAAIFTSRTSGNSTLMGRPATNSTASLMPASRKRACTPTSAMGISVCSKLSGSMKKQWFSSA
jgi:hypothetical protein